MTQLPDPGSVVKIGDGRGFVVKHRTRIPSLLSARVLAETGRRTRKFREHRLVVTAAHCLPNLPPAHADSFPGERTWRLLGTLDGSKTGLFVECLFVNPIADIAVLGPPDLAADGDVRKDPSAYDELMEAVQPLQIGRASSGRGCVLSLDRKWIRTTLEVGEGSRVLRIGPTEPGMSGSPVLNDAGHAVAVIVMSRWQPILMREFPGWLRRP